MLIFHHHMRGFGIIILVVHLYTTFAKTTVFTGDKLQTFVKNGLPITKLSGDNYIAVDLHREGRRQYYHLKSRGDTIHVKQFFVLVRKRKSAVLKELKNTKVKDGLLRRMGRWLKKRLLCGGCVEESHPQADYTDIFRFVYLLRDGHPPLVLEEGDTLYTDKKSSANILMPKTITDSQLAVQMRHLMFFAYEFPLFPKDVKNSNESFVVEYYTSHTGDEDEERDTYSKSVFYDSSKPIADDTALQRIVKGKGFKKWLIKQSKDEHQDNIKTKIQPEIMTSLILTTPSAFESSLSSEFIERLCRNVSNDTVMAVVSSSGAAQYYLIFDATLNEVPDPFDHFDCGEDQYVVHRVNYLLDLNFYSGKEGHAFLLINPWEMLGRFLSNFEPIANGVFLAKDSIVSYSRVTKEYHDSSKSRLLIVDFITSLPAEELLMLR